MGLSQSRVAAEIGLEQHKLSKSLTGKRRFRDEERDRLARLLCEPSPPELEPDALSMARRFAALSQDRQELMRSMIDTLEAQQSAQTPKTSDTEGQGGDSPG